MLLNPHHDRLVSGKDGGGVQTFLIEFTRISWTRLARVGGACPPPLGYATTFYLWSVLDLLPLIASSVWFAVSDVNKDWTLKDEDEDKDLTLKDKDKDKGKDLPRVA